MKKARERLSLAAVGLVATPVVVLSAIQSGGFAVSLGALAALLAGIVATLAAVEVLKQWY